MRPRRAPWIVVCAVALSLSGCAVTRGFDPRTARFAPPTFVPPTPHQTRLGTDGPPLFWLEDHDVPLVRLTLSFRGGELYDPDDRLGLSRVAERAWRTGGAGALTPEAFDNALDDRGMELGLHLGRSHGSLTLSVLSDDLTRGLDLLADLVWRPAFRDDRVVWARTQVAEALRRVVDDPQALAFRELRRALYRGHPRGRVPTPAAVGEITRDDVAALQRRLVTEGRWVLGAVGDFDPKRLATLLGERFDRLPVGGDGFPSLPPPKTSRPRTVLVPRALPQATLVWARLGPARPDPAYASLAVVNHALGAGGFGSRLVREIRSDRGLAYSVGSFYQGLPNFGVVGAYALTKTESVTEVRTLLADEIRKVAREGLETQELTRSKAALVNRRVFRYDDPAEIVTERARLWLDDLPADLEARYPTQVVAVTGAAASAAARILDPSEGVWVVVGDLDPADLGGDEVEVVEVQ